MVTALVFLGRVFVKRCLKPKKSDSKKILLVTDFSDEDKLEEVLKSSNYQVLAYVSHNKRSDLEYPVIWELDGIRDFVANHQVDEIFINTNYQSDFREIGRYIRLLGIPTTIKADNLSDYYVSDSVVKKLGDLTFVTTAVNIVKCRQLILKRLLDIVGALVGIILTGIAAIVIAPIVKKNHLVL